jgi:hypothetical protein
VNRSERRAYVAQERQRQREAAREARAKDEPRTLPEGPWGKVIPGTEPHQLDVQCTRCWQFVEVALLETHACEARKLPPPDELPARSDKALRRSSRRLASELGRGRLVR